MKISIEEARQFLIHHQHLDTPLSGKEGVLEYVKKAGCIQYDPLNIVGRNADLVLQSRIDNYKPEILTSLLYGDRSLIDGWDKVMSIYRTEDWPYFHLVREQRGKETISMLQNRGSDQALGYIEAVLNAIAENGPLQPKQVGQGQTGSGSWGHRNIYGATMDYLFHIGKLGVSNKLNVNKVYDLTQNLIPPHILERQAPFETLYDFQKWHVYRRIASIGMLWNRNGGGWYGTLIPNKTERQQILSELVSEGRVTEIEVEGIPDKFYARSTDISRGLTQTASNSNPASAGKTTKFIAPLDNLIWDRDMTAKIFGFEYTWEVYIPAAKRKYGYYVLPVLHDNRFVARFEPEKSPTHLCIKNWWWEKDVTVTPEIIDSAIQAMKRFAAFLDKKQGVHESAHAMLDR